MKDKLNHRLFRVGFMGQTYNKTNHELKEAHKKCLFLMDLQTVCSNSYHNAFNELAREMGTPENIIAQSSVQYWLEKYETDPRNYDEILEIVKAAHEGRSPNIKPKVHCD